VEIPCSDKSAKSKTSNFGLLLLRFLKCRFKIRKKTYSRTMVGPTVLWETYHRPNALGLHFHSSLGKEVELATCSKLPDDDLD